jgi:MoxR-like ATPase
MSDDARAKPVPIGPALARLLDVTRAAGLPALLVGRHGIGKSEFLEAWAKERGMTPFVLDLSLLEATDLTGIPFVDKGTTRFAPPATLPPGRLEGPSLLVLEELNRCDRSVRQPCLQLLTTRRLNEYVLPDGCFVTACVNPPDAGYDVDELDDALASRFARIPVEPERSAWIAWARAAKVPEVLVGFVERYRQAFETHPPRAWTFAGRIAAAAIERRANGDELARALSTVLGPIATHALILELMDRTETTPGPSEIVKNPQAHVALVERLTKEKRLDVLKELLDGVAELLDTEPGRLALRAPGARVGIRDLALAAPPDLTKGVLACLDAEPRAAGGGSGRG